MRILTSVFSILALTFALGCSGGDDDDDGGGNPADAAVGDTPDAAGGGPDAMPQGTADGTACTATQEDPTGGCPTGYACLSAGGPGNCAELCNLTTTEPIQADGAACPNYQGPGVSLCITTLSAGEGMPPSAAACGVFCEDASGTVPGCQGAACDGTCPGTWSCNQHPNPQAPQGLKLCQ